MQAERSKAGQLLVKLALVAIGFTLAISAWYLWLLPMIFGGHYTFIFLIAGLFAAYLAGGYLGYCHDADRSPVTRVLIGLVSGLGVLVLVLFFSLLIMIRTKRA